MSILKDFTADQLHVQVMDSRDEMGKIAAAAAAKCLRSILAAKPCANVIFAAAPSQNETLHYLVNEPDIDWTRVNAFHMDEYIGLPAGAPQAFGNFLREHIFALVPFASVNYLNSQTTNAAEECVRLCEAAFGAEDPATADARRFAEKFR